MNENLLALQDLSKYYTTGQTVTVGLSHIDLAFRRGEFVAVTGESGSGKSTLAHVLGGILRYEGGELLFGGRPTSHYDSADWERYRRDCVSFISQSYGILPGSTVLDNVTCALRLSGISKERAAGDAEDILKRVELWDLRRRRAAKLSSGQKQRLSIARALAKPAPVLIADEPTGNLDAENSAMVIKLLAEAAKDRLVILITHEFSEAEDYVTRHIELHDGRVTVDAQLREAPQLPAAAPEKTGGKREKGLSWFVSRFQMKARPVWSALMLVLFAFTVFAMFAFAGTFLSNLDDTFTYKYDNSAFRNGDSRRIAVARTDGGELTGEDIAALRAVRYVESVEEYGCVTDIQYAYREGVDYEIQRGLKPDGLFDYVATESYSLRRTEGQMPFLRTVPALPEGQTFLTAGRLPENIYEVVAAGGEELLGQEITVLLQDRKNWSVDIFVKIEVTVVGVTDYGEHLYFHRDVGRVMTVGAREADMRFLYLPLPGDACAVGEERTETLTTRDLINPNQWVPYYYYKLVNGNVTTADKEEDTAWKRVQEVGLSELDRMERILDRYQIILEGDTAEGIHSNWVTIRSYARRFGIGEDLDKLSEELGLDRDDLWEPGTGLTTTGWEIFWDDEVRARIKEVCDPVAEELKTLIAKERETLEKDPALVSQEERRAVAARWGLDEQGRHPIQPGEAVVSTYALNSIERQVTLGKTGMTDAEAEKAQAQADFITYAFPDLRATQAAEQARRAEGKSAGGEVVTRDLKVLTIGSLGTHMWTVLLHPEDFDAMIPLRGNQATVFVEDYAYVDRALKELRGLGYAALSPYQEGAVTQNETLAAQRTQTLRVSLIALLAVIVLQILLLRAMFSVETESYRLLSNIGLDCATARRSVFWQVMVFALGGQVLGVGAITACAAGGVEQVARILRYLPLGCRAALCLVHLAASAFTAAWAMGALKKQVFPASGAAPDLDWDGIDGEVEA